MAQDDIHDEQTEPSEEHKQLEQFEYTDERETILWVKQLKKGYTIPGGQLQVLHDVNFTAQQGEFVAITGQSGSGHQCLRAIPRTARAGTRSWSECHGHLAGPGFRSGLSPWLPDREAFCSQASRFYTTPSRGDYSHRSWRRSTGRLRIGPDGARSAERKISPNALVRADAWL